MQGIFINPKFMEEQKYENAETPSKIIQKINQGNNYFQSNIISNKIKMNRIINNYQCNDSRTYNTDRTNKTNKNIYSNRTTNMLPKNNININTPIIYRNNNNSIYNKKKLSNCFTSSSIPSGKNSFSSNLNMQNNNINIIENIPYKHHTELQEKNNNNMKKYKNNKTPNILIKKIYETEDFFNKDIKEGLLYLKDFKVLKPNDYLFMDTSNDETEKNKKNKKVISPNLSKYLIKIDKKPKKNFSYSETKNLKHYEIKKSCDSIRNRSRKKAISKTLVNGKKIERELSEPHQRNKFTLVKKGKIANILNFFNNKGSLSDIIITRGMRSEKGGVVDFTMASPKKKYSLNKYDINSDIFKNLNKYNKLEIINAAKIIQKWWRKIILTYYNYLNKIKLIQDAFRYYYNRKCKKFNNNIKKEKDRNSKQIKEFEKILKDKYKIIGTTILKKVIEVKLINNFNYLLLKIKDILSYKPNENILNAKNKLFILIIKDYFNKIKNKNYFSFMRKLKFIRNNSKNLKVIKLSSLFFEGQKDLKKENKNINKILKNLSNEENKDINIQNKHLLNSTNKNLKKIQNTKVNIIPSSNNNKECYTSKKYEIDKNKKNYIINNKKKEKNIIIQKVNKKLFNEKEKKVLLNIKNNPNEICKYIIKKIYIRKWHNKMFLLKKAWKVRINEYKKIILKINNIFLKNLMIDIIEKIRKEAKRRTLIIAFRDINKLKYPILFYSFLKIRKYSIVKYNIMNAYAKLIQKNYKYYKNKKSRLNQMIEID